MPDRRQDDPASPPGGRTDRQLWMGLLARAPAGRLAELWAGSGCDPAHEILRAPEIGSVMVRGRAGATGAPFNLGEVTVTRCSVRLASGECGHGYVQGRDRDHARTAALIDAMMQTPEAGHLRSCLLAPLRQEAAARKTRRAERAAATRVEFLTLARGED